MEWASKLSRAAQLQPIVGVFVNDIRQWGDYETKSFDLHRKLGAHADDRRANAKQPGTQKGSAKAKRVPWARRHEQLQADGAAAHVFRDALSPAGIFRRTVPRTGI